MNIDLDPQSRQILSALENHFSRLSSNVSWLAGELSTLNVHMKQLTDHLTKTERVAQALKRED